MRICKYDSFHRLKVIVLSFVERKSTVKYSFPPNSRHCFVFELKLSRRHHPQKTAPIKLNHLEDSVALFIRCTAGSPVFYERIIKQIFSHFHIHPVFYERIIKQIFSHFHIHPVFYERIIKKSSVIFIYTAWSS